jgi:hypothetical protein
MVTEAKEEGDWLDGSLFSYERVNPYMEYLYQRDTYVLKKKANYLERLICSIVP